MGCFKRRKDSEMYVCKVIIVVHLSVMEIFFLATFYEENEYLFRKMTSSGMTSEEVTELWHKLAKAVITENELARQ
jgi:hypothetical protein